MSELAGEYTPQHILLLSKDCYSWRERKALYDLVGDHFYTVKIPGGWMDEFWKWYNRMKQGDGDDVEVLTGEEQDDISEEAKEAYRKLERKVEVEEEE